MANAKPLPSWNVLSKHDVLPEANHDEVSRLNFLTHLNVHLSANILPGVKTVYEKTVLPEFIEDTGHEPRYKASHAKASLFSNVEWFTQKHNGNASASRACTSIKANRTACR